MNDQTIKKLKKAQKNCADNIMLLAWGSDHSYPEIEDIERAKELLEIIASIEALFNTTEISYGVKEDS